MKILFLSVHPPQGGGSAYSSQELAMGLRHLGHQVLHLAPYKNTNNLVEQPGLIWFPGEFRGELKISLQERSNMDREVQNTYLLHGPFDVVILGRECFLWHLPAIRQLHGSRPVIAIARGGYINRLAASDSIEPELKEEIFQLYRDCDLIVCIARYLAKSIQKVVGVNNTVFLPNPIDLPAFNPTTNLPAFKDACNYLERSCEPIRLLMAAQLTPRKRPLDAVEIVRILTTQGVNVHLTVCGDGPELKEMLLCIRKYGLEEKIALKGSVQRQEVLDCMNQVETVLLCSDREGRPRILQEAIAMGKAVVAYDNPGSREVLNEWLDRWPLGRLVAIGDTVGASEAILELARYFRSQPQPLPPPILPNPMEVLADYEAVLATLAAHSSFNGQLSLIYK